MIQFFPFELVILLVGLFTINAIQNPCRKGKEAFFPHPESETKFIQCSNFGQMFEFSCPSGLIWNQPTASCQKGQASSAKPINQIVESVTQAAETIATTTHMITTTLTHMAIPTTSDAFVKIFMTETASSGVFDNEICNNLEIKNLNVPLINGVYTKNEAKVFRRSDNPQIPGFISVVRGKWCITYSFSPDNLNSIDLEFLEKNCGSNFECCQFLSDSSGVLGLTDPKMLWRNSRTMQTESLGISCKVDTIVSSNVNSIEKPLTQQHHLSTQESGAQANVHKNLLQKLIVDHLMPSNSIIDSIQPIQPLVEPIQPSAQPIQSFAQPIQQPFQPLTQANLKFDKVLSSSLKIDKSNSTTAFEEIKVNSCDQIKCPKDLVCGKRSDCADCNPMCFHKDKVSFQHAVFINCDNVVCPKQFKCKLDTNNSTKCINDDIALRNITPQREIATISTPVPITCEFVKCPSQTVCVIQKKSNPICSGFASGLLLPSGISFQNIIRVDCGAISCPNSLKCGLNDMTKLLMCQ